MKTKEERIIKKLAHHTMCMVHGCYAARVDHMSSTIKGKLCIEHFKDWQEYGPMISYKLDRVDILSMFNGFLKDANETE